MTRPPRHENCTFPEPDTLTIELADRVSSSSEAVSDNLIVDFDERGQAGGGDAGALLPDQRHQHDPYPAADHPCAAAGLMRQGSISLQQTTASVHQAAGALAAGNDRFHCSSHSSGW
jgi:hypothetical protein